MVSGQDSWPVKYNMSAPLSRFGNRSSCASVGELSRVLGMEWEVEMEVEAS
jgi:hypothetical protein